MFVCAVWAALSVAAGVPVAGVPAVPVAAFVVPAVLPAAPLAVPAAAAALFVPVTFDVVPPPFSGAALDDWMRVTVAAGTVSPLSNSSTAVPSESNCTPVTIPATSWSAASGVLDLGGYIFADQLAHARRMLLLG